MAKWLRELFKLNKKNLNKISKTSVDKSEPSINEKIGEITFLRGENAHT